jgi:hypothetical protein
VTQSIFAALEPGYTRLKASGGRNRPLERIVGG